MHIRTNKASQNKLSSNQSTQPLSNSQYGIQVLPDESLLHIASHLDPRSLYFLAQVSRYFNRLVSDDHTWHRAFLCQYFGISPEADLNDAKCLLLRRSSASWKLEFTRYYILRRRWERSRNATTTHIPLHSAISSMHLMPSHGLISSSLRYGVVARSLPFTGRVLRGFLDASGSGTGLGIGNPNTEFSPNVSACSLASDGGTAKIAWGFRNGEVAFTSANKAMDTASRSAAKFTRCSVEDAHHGAVSEVIWDGSLVASTGSDGKVKLWDPKQGRCLWTSAGSIVQEECIRIAAAIDQGIIAAAYDSGTISVWSGISVSQSPGSVSSVTIPAPMDDSAPHSVSGLYIDRNRVLLASFVDSIFFYRFHIDPTTNAINCTKFGDAALGSITTITPFFAEKAGEPSLVITGTQLGCIAIYDWSQSISPLPTYKFEAYADGTSVTALAWNGLTLVTGCAQGTTRIFDALTLEYLRSFPSPIPRRRTAPAFAGGPLAEDPAVKQILLGSERDVLFVAVGDRVVAWRAGPVPKGGYRSPAKSLSGKKRERGDANSKAYQHIEMRQAISDSKYLLADEGRHSQRAYGREREQRAQLDTLGLSEVEAVEYVLMLSREDAIERASHQSQPLDEGEWDTSRSSSSTASSSPSPSTSRGQPIMIPRASNSSSKVQVSPPESIEAFLQSATSDTVGNFPQIGGSISPPRSGAKKSAWSTPLTTSPVVSPANSDGVTSSAANTSRKEDEMDDDLQLAIALSLSQMK
ncbi:hypothetical protein MIND_00093400 [Mycena indigotica]|uniref:F-box domain-containing protein n=1 Tax=Mycena indigotica TaxID=2126181 RepID=A0A8H6WKI6_9AGAR|nr:uncharacterized protein MIND_00093400 [Mycena indigotica]KAF7315774.1 hypothetical protein MIND_00093400 [Mycena indigotica]